jgi:hypothetical protein
MTGLGFRDSPKMLVENEIIITSRRPVRDGMCIFPCTLRTSNFVYITPRSKKKH